MLYIQACLKEIHASLLRKHLERLEQPAEVEQGLETDNEIKFKEEDVVLDAAGMVSYLNLNFFAISLFSGALYEYFI